MYRFECDISEFSMCTMLISHGTGYQRTRSYDSSGSLQCTIKFYNISVLLFLWQKFLWQNKILLLLSDAAREMRGCGPHRAALARGCKLVKIVLTKFTWKFRLHVSYMFVKNSQRVPIVGTVG